jgi:PAS domain S-box-containing protein
MNVALRWRVLLTILGVSCALFAVAFCYLLDRAFAEKGGLESQAAQAALAHSFATDQEIAKTATLLKGLSSSPALKSGDLRRFYEQLVSTPHAEGSWFIVWDLGGQVLNTLLPFGEKLPLFSEIGVPEARLRELRNAEVNVSNYVIGPVSRTPAINVHLRLTDATGEMTGFMTAPLPQAQLNAVLRLNQDRGWKVTAVDRQLKPFATNWSGDSAPASLPGYLLKALQGHRGEAALLARTDDGGLLAMRRSSATGFATLVEVPKGEVWGPLSHAYRAAAAIAVLCVAVGLAAGLAVAREVAPVEKRARANERLLRLAQARYESLWADTPESLFVVTVTEDEDFVFEGLNPAHERATGIRTDRIAGRRPSDCLPGDVAEAVVSRYRSCLRSGHPSIYEEVLDLPAGRRRWQTSLSPVRDPHNGRIIALVGTARDVTQERDSQARAEKGELLLQSTLDALSAHIAILDEAGFVVAVNRAWRRFGEERGMKDAAFGVGSNYVSSCLASRSLDRSARRNINGVRDVLSGVLQSFRSSYRCAERYFQMTVARFRAGDETHVVVAHEDITDLRNAQTELQTTFDRLLSLQEEEQAKIASDLHDSTAQHLVAASLGLTSLRNSFTEKHHGIVIDDIQSALQSAQKEIRTFSYLLYPPELRRFGLAATLRQFVCGFSQRGGVRARALIDDRVDELPVDVQRTVLRIVQEALTNVHRHAQASRVAVSVGAGSRGLRIGVRDNGVGMPADPATRNRGLGLAGMEARIRHIGGALTIETSATGTTIRANALQAA